MSRGNGHRKRRSIFRPNAGGAFLRFLFGVLLLAVLCGLFYLFVLEGEINFRLPVDMSSSTSEPSALVTPAPTPVPTIEPTAGPTATPIPEPSATPVPPEAMTVPLQDAIQNLPQMPDESLKLGLNELSLFDEAGQNVIIVRGYAYIQGRDAAQSRGYILLTDPLSGHLLSAYPVTPRAEEAYLSFDGTAGANLDQAFFWMNIDVSGLPDGYYIVCVAMENGGRTVWNYFDDSMYHFRVEQGVVMLCE